MALRKVADNSTFQEVSHCYLNLLHCILLSDNNLYYSSLLVGDCWNRDVFRLDFCVARHKSKRFICV